MGKRGPPPQPQHLRLLKGDARPSRAKPPIEATIAPELPAPPAFIGGHALDEWHAVAGELHRLGLLSVLDVGPLAAWCCAAGRFRAACEALQALPESERLLVKGEPQPLARIVRNVAAEMHRLGAPFGLSGPASRQRLAGVVKKPASKFTGFIGGDEPA